MLTPIMDKVVILARVSTDKQEYQRQVNELTDYCTRVGWSMEAVFSNKVSGECGLRRGGVSIQSKAEKGAGPVA